VRRLVTITLLACVGAFAVGCGIGGRSPVREAEVDEQFDELTALLMLAADGLPRDEIDSVEAHSTKVETKFPDARRNPRLTARVSLAVDSPRAPTDVARQVLRTLRADGWTDDGDVRDEPGYIHADLRCGEGLALWRLTLFARDDPESGSRSVVLSVAGPTVDH
jgi:hypothetical protein